MTQIAPSLLACDFGNLEAEVRTVEANASDCATVHCSGATGSDDVWQLSRLNRYPS